MGWKGAAEGKGRARLSCLFGGGANVQENYFAWRGARESPKSKGMRESPLQLLDTASLQGVGNFRDFGILPETFGCRTKSLLLLAVFWYITGMAAPDPKRHWFIPTPGHFLAVLLATEGILFLAERWIPKGWAVLAAVAAVGVFLIGMLVWFVLALLFRWRFQFSLRSLLLLTVAVAIPASWLAVEMKRAREQREMEKNIRELGGHVECDWQVGSDLGVVYYIDTQLHAPYWLWRMMGYHFFATAVKADFHNSPLVTEHALWQLKGLNQLKCIDLRHTRVTDEDVKKLEQALHDCKIVH